MMKKIISVLGVGCILFAGAMASSTSPALEPLRKLGMTDGEYKQLLKKGMNVSDLETLSNIPDLTAKELRTDFIFPVLKSGFKWQIKLAALQEKHTPKPVKKEVKTSKEKITPKPTPTPKPDVVKTKEQVKQKMAKPWDCVCGYNTEPDINTKCSICKRTWAQSEADREAEAKKPPAKTTVTPTTPKEEKVAEWTCAMCKNKNTTEICKCELTENMAKIIAEQQEREWLESPVIKEMNDLLNWHTRLLKRKDEENITPRISMFLDALRSPANYEKNYSSSLRTYANGKPALWLALDDFTPDQLLAFLLPSNDKKSLYGDLYFFDDFANKTRLDLMLGLCAGQELNQDFLTRIFWKDSQSPGMSFVEQAEARKADTKDKKEQALWDRIITQIKDAINQAQKQAKKTS